MLFGCLPIQNISVFIVMCGVLAFSVWMLWTDYKDDQREKIAARVRRAEVHRRAMAAIAAGKRERANKYVGRYHGLV